MKSPKILQLDESTWRIAEGFGGSRTYMYLVAGREKAALIDTGFGLTDMARVARRLTEKPVIVLSTHGHLDHIGSNYRFGEVYLSPFDEALFQEHTRYDVRRDFAQGLLKEYNAPQWLLNMPVVHGISERAFYVPTNENRRPLEDGAIFDLGERTLEAVSTPGHTLGSFCFLERDRHRLYTGDSVCDEGVLLHFDTSAPVSVFHESMMKLEGTSGLYDEIWPGHHLAPLTKKHLKAYIELCEDIMENKCRPEAFQSAAGEGLRVKKGSIAITYRASRF